MPGQSSDTMALGSSKGLQTIYMKGSNEGKSTFMFVLPEDQKPFQCGLCYVAFDLNRELVTHVKAHLLTQPFQCGYCKVSYETNFELKVHVKTHRLFVCVSPESGSAMQSNVAQEQEPGVKKISQYSSEWNTENQELLTLGISEPSRPEKDDEKKFAKDSKDTSSGFDLARSQVLMSGSSKVNISNQNLTIDDAASFPKVKVTRLDRDIERMVIKIKEEVLDASGTLKPSRPTDSLTHVALDSLNLIVEDADDSDDLDDGNDCEWLPEDDGDNFCERSSKTDQRTVLQDTLSVADAVNRDTNAKQNYTNHISSDHKPMEMSDDDSTDSSQLVRHVQHSTGDDDKSLQPFVCFLCGDGFEDSKDVGYHFRRVHKKGRDQVVLLPPSPGHQKDIICFDDGGDRSSEHCNTYKHFKCYVCEKTFKSRHDMSHHTLTVHPENDLRIYECGVCGRKFKMAHHVKDHFNARHGGGCKRIRLHQSREHKYKFVVPSERRTRSCRSTDASLPQSDSSSSGQKPSADSLTDGASDSHGKRAGDTDDRGGLVTSFDKNVHPSIDSGNSLCDLSSVIDHIDCGHHIDYGHHIDCDHHIDCGHHKDCGQLSIATKQSRKSEITASSSDVFQDGSVLQDQDRVESTDKNVIQSGFQDNKRILNTSFVEDRTQFQVSSSTIDTASSASLLSNDTSMSDQRPINLKADVFVDAPQAGQLAQLSTRGNKSLTPYICSLCGDGFEDSKDVGSHFRSVHRKGKDEVVICPPSPDHCSGEINTAISGGDGDDHSSNDNTSPPFKCYICEQAFKFRHVMTRHVLKEHRQKDLRVFECGICGYKFKMAHHVRDHFDVRHGSGCNRRPRRHMYNHKFKLSRDSKHSMNSCPSAGSSLLISEASSGFGKQGNDFTDCTLQSFETAAEASILGEGLHTNDDNLQLIAADGKEIFGVSTSTEEQMDFKQLSVVSQSRTAESEMKWTCSVSGEDQLFRPFVCSLCGDSFPDTKDVGHHFRRMHKKGKDGSILLLPRVSSTDQDTASHATETDSSTFFHNNDTFFQESLQSFKCDMCKETFKFRYEMSHHILTVHPEKDLRVFECGVCWVRFKMAHHLKDHFDACHGSGLARPHQCDICGQKFKLLHHMKSHSYSCLIRHGSQTGLEADHGESSVLKIKAALVSRVKSDGHSEHVSARKSPNKAGKKTVSMCHICGKSVHSFTALQSHILALHSDVKPFQCNLCTRAFKSKTSFDVHMKTHTKEKPYICEICGRSFATRSTFKCHKHTHTNAKPFQCEICQKGFNSYSGLGHHRLKHKKNKRHTCEECGKKFYTSGLLKNHAVTHTDLRPLSCKKCGKTYRSSSSLRYHMINTHPS